MTNPKKPLRRHRPSDAYKAKLRPMSQKDYNALEFACAQAHLTGSQFVIVRVSYLTKIPDDFPKRIKVTRDGYDDLLKVNANKLLRWLNKHGHSDITSWKLGMAEHSFNRSMGELFNELEI